MAEPTLWVCQHREPRRLKLVHVDGRQAIVHVVTGEMSLAPELDGRQQWRLQFDDEGAGFLHADGQDSIWADDLLEWTLSHTGARPDEEGSLMVVPQSTAAASRAVPLETFRVACRPNLTYDVQLENIGSLHLKCMVLRSARHGFHVLWSVLSLHSALGLTSQGKAGKWAAHGWQRWCVWLTSIGLCSEHIVNKSGNCEDDRVGETMMHEDGGLEWRGISSVTLFALLVRFAHGRAERLRDYDDMQKVKALLRSFAGKCFGGRLKWTLWVSFMPVWHPPLAPRGQASEPFVVIDIVDGLVQLGPLFGACPMPFMKAFGGISG